MYRQNNNHVVIMAGGSGQRFWPWSTKAMPKQFHDFLGMGKTLLQATAERFKEIIPHEHIWVVTQASYATIVKKQLPWIDKQQILCEPVPKNTAPCIAYACCEISKAYPEATLIITPADHIIQKKDLFINAIQQALQFEGPPLAIVLLGTPCKKSETGYGYIAYNKEQAGAVKAIVNFVEKPPREQAKAYIEQANYVWNTGIFVGKVSAFIKNFEAHLPKIWQIFEQSCIFSDFNAQKVQSSLTTLYRSLPAISFDKGIIEKAMYRYVICEEFGWADLGTWNAVYERLYKDDTGNSYQGQVVTLATSNCLIKGDSQRLIVTYGLDDLVIVQHQDVLLICPQDEVQNLKKIVKKLEEDGYEKYI